MSKVCEEQDELCDMCSLRTHIFSDRRHHRRFVVTMTTVELGALYDVSVTVDYNVTSP